MPFKKWDPTESDLRLDSSAIKLPTEDLGNLDQILSHAAINPGVSKNLADQLPSDSYKALRRDYLHHSASSQGIANPANINKYESTISKERRELVDNKGS